VKEAKLWDIEPRSRFYLFQKYFSLPDIVEVLNENEMKSTMNILYEAPLLKAFFSSYEEKVYTNMKKAGVTDNKLTEILNMDIGESTLLHALSDEEIDIVNFLLDNNFDFEKPNGNQQTPLHIAGVNNCIQIVEKLLALKASVTAQDIMHNTPLHFACYFSRFNVIKKLLENNANTEATNKEEQQPFDMAPPENKEQIQELLKIKLKPKEKNREN